ncbi:MAG: DNA translocase FtsK 4TM domain-containing protein, partial [Promethearchaeota archaeon]
MGDGIRRDALAILFLTVGIFLTVALVSFHQMDPSLSTWSSKGAVVHNWGGAVGAIVSDLLLQLFGLGAVGAIVSDLLLQLFGLGAVGFPILCLALAYWTFRGEKMAGKWSRAAGGLLAVCSLLGIASFFTGHVRWFGADIFLPGVVGHLLGVNFFGKLLSKVGGLICLVALFLFSLMLFTGLPLRGLPTLWRRKKTTEQVRAIVKEKMVSRDDWGGDKPAREAAPAGRRNASSPRIVASPPVP